MALSWIREDTPVWDAAKQSIVGGTPEGALSLAPLQAGELVPGEWFRVDDDGAAVGFGWMDLTWGDAEVTLAVDPSRDRVTGWLETLGFLPSGDGLLKKRVGR